MSLPTGDWDKTYDAGEGTTLNIQGWGSTDPGSMVDGYQEMAYNNVTGAAVQFNELLVLTTFAARFKVPAPTGSSLGAAFMQIGNGPGNAIGYLLFSTDGLKTSDDLATFHVIYDEVDFEDGEFHEVYAIRQDDHIVAYIDGIEVPTTIPLLDTGFAYGIYSFQSPGIGSGSGWINKSLVDWVVVSYDDQIIPAGGSSIGADITLGATGITVDFDEFALYRFPLSEATILRHYQSGAGLPSL